MLCANSSRRRQTPSPGKPRSWKRRSNTAMLPAVLTGGPASSRVRAIGTPIAARSPVGQTHILGGPRGRSSKMSRSELQPEPAKSPARQKARHVSQHLPALFLAVLCGLVFFEAATTLTEQGYASGTPISNAALYPRLLAGLLLVLLAMQVVSDLRSGREKAAGEPAAAPD